MKEHRIKKKNEGHIDLSPTHSGVKNTQLLSITIHEWSHGINKDSTIQLDLLRTKELSDYLHNYLQENDKAFKQLQNTKAKKLAILKNTYEIAKESGLLTIDLLNNLSEIGIPIISLLAQDLEIPANDMKDLVTFTPLPFQMLKKHYEKCKAYLLEELA